MNASQRVADWRRRTKKKLIAYKGGQCEICGYCKDCPTCYDFHHINPEEKEFGLSSRHITRKWEKLLKEADKCMLLCKLCHAEIHDNEYKQKIERKHYAEDRECPICKCKFRWTRYNQKTYCSNKCRGVHRRKIERPSLENLRVEVESLGYCAVGRKYGVSDNAIRKWLN